MTREARATLTADQLHAGILREYDRRIAMLATNKDVKVGGDLGVKVEGTFATYDLGLAVGLRTAADVVLNGRVYADARANSPTSTLRDVYEAIIAKRAADGHEAAGR